MRRFVFIAAVHRCGDFPIILNIVLGKGVNDLIYPKIIYQSALDSSLQEFTVIASRVLSALEAQEASIKGNAYMHHVPLSCLQYQKMPCI